jgi:alkylation response protein AidB-like acyl-CoA dehydrogenase
MNFDLAEDQVLLRDSVARLMAAEYGFEARRAHMGGPRGWSEAMWSRYAALGLQGLLVPVGHGGYGGGGVELMQVMQELGRALAMEPFLHGAVLPAAAIAAAGSEAQQAALLPRIADGSLRAAFAHAEPGGRGGAAEIATTAHFDGAGWLLRGSKDLVVQGGDAALLVITARSAGEFGDRENIRLFAITPDRPGLRRRAFRMQDGRAAAEIMLDGVRAEGGELLHRPGVDSFAAVEQVIQTAIAGIVAESLGSMDALFGMTVDYLKTRVQFGRPIGSNQSLQHRAAEMLVALEQARGMAMLAAASLGEADAEARRRNLSMAKAHVSELGRSLSKAAVQLHGGIAMTEEYAVGHHFKRLMVNEQLFGAPRHHLAFLAGTLPFAAPTRPAKPLTQSADMVLSA